MFSGFDFDVIQRSAGYLFREGMTFTVTLTLVAMAFACAVASEVGWRYSVRHYTSASS